MGERSRLILLILIMAAVSLVVAGTAIFILYKTGFEGERGRLVEIAQSSLNLIFCLLFYSASINNYKLCTI